MNVLDRRVTLQRRLLHLLLLGPHGDLLRRTIHDLLLLLILTNRLSTMTRVLLDKLDQVAVRALALVGDRVRLVVGPVQAHPRDVRHVLGQVVLHDIHLGDDDVRAARAAAVRLGQRVVYRRQGLAVGAVLAEVVQQDVLGAVEHDVLEAVGHDGGDGPCLHGGDRLGLDDGLEAAGEEVVGEAADVARRQVLGVALGGVGVLGALGAVVDCEGREVLLGAVLEVQVARETGEVGRLGRRECQPPLELLGQRSQLVHDRPPVVVGSREDEGGGAVVARDVVAPGAVAELADQRGVGGLGERLDGLDILDVALVNLLALAVGLVHNDRGEADTCSGGGVRVKSHADREVLVELLGGGPERALGDCVFRVEVAHQDDLLLLLLKERIMDRLGGKRVDGGEHLLLHKVNNAGIRLAGRHHWLSRRLGLFMFLTQKISLVHHIRDTAHGPP